MTAERREWDLIVVGLGALGSGAAYWASTHPGARVLGLEQFESGHANGASADHSRIIRLSYHRPDYVRLAKRAYETWAEVEAESGERIVTVTGGLDLWPADPAIPKADYTDSLTAEHVPFEMLDADEVMRRWPQWRVDEGTTAMFQAQGGLADPFKGNAAHRRLAQAHGATLLDRTPVASLRDVGGEVELVAGGVTHRAPDRGRRGGRVDQRAAGAVRAPPAADDHEGAGHVLRGGGPGRVRAGPLPGLDLDGRPVLLRLPDLWRGRPEGRPGLRRPGDDAGGADVRARPRRRRPPARLHGPPPADGARTRGSTRRPACTRSPRTATSCVDRVPEAPGVIVLLGAAHAFKFASVLGRIAAELGARRRHAIGCRSSSDSASIDRSCSRRRPPRPGWCSA